MSFDAFLAKLNDPAVDRITIVALGDSNTELTWHTRGHLNWCGLLQEALFEKYGHGRCFVINAGSCGNSAEAGLNRLEKDVFRFSPDLVIVSFGGNDAVAGMDYLPVYERSVTDIVRRCREKGAAVLLRTTNPFLYAPWKAGREGLESGGEIEGLAQGDFSRAMVALAAREGCPVVDHFSIWKARRFPKYAEDPICPWLYMSDEVHPGALGHLAFYREIAPQFGLPERFPWEG